MDIKSLPIYQTYFNECDEAFNKFSNVHDEIAKRLLAFLNEKILTNNETLIFKTPTYLDDSLKFLSNDSNLAFSFVFNLVLKENVIPDDDSFLCYDINFLAEKNFCENEVRFNAEFFNRNSAFKINKFNCDVFESISKLNSINTEISDLCKFLIESTGLKNIFDDYYFKKKRAYNFKSNLDIAAKQHHAIYLKNLLNSELETGSITTVYPHKDQTNRIKIKFKKSSSFEYRFNDNVWPFLKTFREIKLTHFKEYSDFHIFRNSSCYSNLIKE